MKQNEAETVTATDWLFSDDDIVVSAAAVPVLADNGCQLAESATSDLTAVDSRRCLGQAQQRRRSRHPQTCQKSQTVKDVVGAALLTF